MWYKGYTYTGHISNSIPNGTGELFAKYSEDLILSARGDFKYGRCLKGVVIFKNGDKFEGNIDEYGRSVGKYFFQNGDVYEGEFFDQQIHGKGKYTWKNGDIFEGAFIDNKINGIGILYSVDTKILKKYGQIAYDLYSGNFTTLSDGRINFDEGKTRKHSTWGRQDGTPPYPLQKPIYISELK